MDDFDNVRINRQHKDRLFRLIFGSGSNRRHLLSLYNALNGTAYTDESRLEITTIQDVIYMGMKNDSSFIIDSELNLFEQQSTYNPNMPFREFEYCAKLFDKWIEEHDLDVYGSTLVKLPTPRCYVFYNGTDRHEDRETLKLSDAFFTESDGCEWTVTMLNINKGHNTELMDNCEALSEYADFVAMVREYAENLKISQAVEQTVAAFIRKGGMLAGFLKAHRAEVVDVCITEYKEELHLRNVRNEGWDEGRKEGRAEGEKRTIKLISILAGQHKYDLIEKVTKDENFRQQCFEQYNL